MEVKNSRQFFTTIERNGKFPAKSKYLPKLKRCTLSSTDMLKDVAVLTTVVVLVADNKAAARSGHYSALHLADARLMVPAAMSSPY